MQHPVVAFFSQFPGLVENALGSAQPSSDSKRSIVIPDDDSPPRPPSSGIIMPQQFSSSSSVEHAVPNLSEIQLVSDSRAGHAGYGKWLSDECTQASISDSQIDDSGYEDWLAKRGSQSIVSDSQIDDSGYEQWLANRCQLTRCNTPSRSSSSTCPFYARPVPHHEQLQQQFSQTRSGQEASTVSNSSSSRRRWKALDQLADNPGAGAGGGLAEDISDEEPLSNLLSRQQAHPQCPKAKVAAAPKPESVVVLGGSPVRGNPVLANADMERLGHKRKRRTRSYSVADRSQATPLIAKLMEAADHNSNVAGGSATFRQLIHQASALAPPEKRPKLNDVLQAFQAKTIGVHGAMLDELISEWSA